MEKQDILLDWALLKWKMHSAGQKKLLVSEGDIW